MGRFESNSLAPRPSHHPPRDSRDLDGRLSGSLAAFKFAISAQCKTIRSDSFRNDFAPRPILLFQKMRGWLRFVGANGQDSDATVLAKDLARPEGNSTGFLLLYSSIAARWV